MEIYAEMHLVFDNEYDVYAITKDIGINPADVKNRYETKISPLTNKQIEGYWTLKSKVFKEGDIKLALDDLISLFVDKSSAIKAICTNNGGEVIFDIVVSFGADNFPAIYFDRNFLDVVDYLNATIQVNLYAN